MFKSYSVSSIYKKTLRALALGCALAVPLHGAALAEPIPVAEESPAAAIVLDDQRETVRTAQQMGLDALAAGKSCREIDRIARETIDARYPGAFGHSLGHGVGLFIHEQPRLSATSKDVLVAGNVVTVEPGVYIPGLGGCRIEDTVIMTGDGFINTLTAPKELIEL